MATKRVEKYQIVRTDRAGVFAGIVVSRKGTETEMRLVRRIWYWTGAASLSQLAMEGTKTPQTCKFSMVVTHEVLLGTIEILDVTSRAQLSIGGVPEWKI